MLKKLLFLCCCAAAVLLLSAGCEKTDSKAKKFTVGFDADFPPYGYRENGLYKGFDLDLAAEVCKRNGWNFVARPIEWSAKDMELNSGSIDCIWNGFSINGREDAYEWSEPYVDNSQVILTEKKSGIRTLNDLAGKRVAVQTDTPVQKALSKGGDKEALGQTFKELLIVPDYNTAVMELEAGSVDAIAMDIGVANKKVIANSAFMILEEPVMSEQYGIGFKKGNRELCDTVVKTLKEMVADGTAAAISKQYFNGQDVLILKK